MAVTVTAQCFRTLPRVIHILDLSDGLLEPSDTPCMFSLVSRENHSLALSSKLTRFDSIWFMKLVFRGFEIWMYVGSTTTLGDLISLSAVTRIVYVYSVKG